MNNEQQTQQADDPSGDGWRDVEPDEVLQPGDMYPIGDQWEPTAGAGALARQCGTGYRRRSEQQQPSDSEPETMEDLRRRLAECEVLLAEAERGGQQVNAELQQLREQVATSQHLAEMSRRQVADEVGKVEQLKAQLRDAVEARQKAERELATETKCYRESFKANHRAGQQQVLERLQEWLTPVLELVAENPEDCAPLAVSILGYLPSIAARLTEE